MSEQEPPRIEFPCDYPIRVMGDAAADFEDYVVGVMRRHAGDVRQVSVRESRGGRYLSVTVTITATGVEQLQAIHVELRDSGRVHMVL